MIPQQHKPGQPVVGFNHNLNYRGRVFHVQTEDSGPQHGHIITHIFLGGNILASTKSSYLDILPAIDPGDIFATVRKLMEEQHKQMMKALLAGAHDPEIARRLGGPVYEPGVLAGGEKAPGLLVGGEKTPTPAPVKGAPLAQPLPAARPSPAPAAPRVSPTAVTPRAPQPTVQPTVQPSVQPAVRPPPAAQPAPTTGSQPIVRPMPGAPAPKPQPAVRPMPTAPQPAGDSLFGDGLLSNRSLDEVILSYLAADLENGPKR